MLYINCYILLAIKYDINSDWIPPLFRDKFKCTHYECNWNDFTKGRDWDFYTDNGRNITGCNTCMQRCQEDSNCHSLECGEDQPLPDGTTKYAHCTWWNKNSCFKYEEFTLNPQNYIWTCKKRLGIFGHIRNLRH